jgi:hypothetical protein
VALTAANAHISALEAKLIAAREAWEGANAAKVAAEKVAKSAETKAKKLRRHFSTLIRRESNESGLQPSGLTRFQFLLAVSVVLFFFGSLLRFILLTFCLLSLACFSVVQQRKLEYLGNFGSRVLKTLC